MEETHEQHKLHGLMQCAIDVTVALEVAVFVYPDAPFWGFFILPLHKLAILPVYRDLLYSKLCTLFLICLVSIGTLAKKEQELDPKKHIIYPLVLGLLLFFGSVFLFGRDSGLAIALTTWFNLAYMICSLFGAILVSISMDNVSKMIRSGLGKDIWFNLNDKSDSDNEGSFRSLSDEQLQEKKLELEQALISISPY